MKFCITYHLKKENVLFVENIMTRTVELSQFELWT